MQKADKNNDNKMTLKELKHFLKQVNIDVDDTYAEEIFKVRHSQIGSHWSFYWAHPIYEYKQISKVSNWFKSCCVYAEMWHVKFWYPGRGGD